MGIFRSHSIGALRKCSYIMNRVNEEVDLGEIEKIRF